MGRRRDTRAKVEYGDFQTPPALASQVCGVLAARGIAPRAILEPTCGLGSLLLAARAAFAEATCAIGMELNASHVADLRGRLPASGRITVERADFFAVDWPARIASLPDPILCLGNPPWVTSADLGALASDNLPAKTNFHGRTGLDAITGKSNFDICEWMLLQLVAALDGRDAVLAMLCKTTVARKVLSFGWQAGHRIRDAAIYRIDAAAHFGAAVDACLLVCELGAGPVTTQCQVYDDLASPAPRATFGHRDGMLLADLARYEQRKDLAGDSPYTWRSGVKHDCAAVMELRRRGELYENGHGELVALEAEHVFPMLKSSEVARDGEVRPTRAMIVTQRYLGDDTRRIAGGAPCTWRYLEAHRESFARRGSSIYKDKPPFAVFGVGDYTFAPWKVAISGLYKKLAFRVVGPVDGRPVVLDDTCYFVACSSEREAHLVWSLLSSREAREFYEAFVFWDAKRPITTELLRRLDLRRVAHVLGFELG